MPLPAAPVSDGSVSDWRDDDLDFAGLQQLLTDMKRKTSGSPHGDFWKKDYDAFVKYEFALQTVEGKVKLLEPGNGAGSNLVRALRGAPLLVRKPDGSMKEEAFSVMPPKGAPMKAADHRAHPALDRPRPPPPRPPAPKTQSRPGARARGRRPRPCPRRSAPTPTPTAPTAPTRLRRDACSPT